MASEGYSSATFHDSIVRVGVEMLTPTLTSALAAAESDSVPGLDPEVEPIKVLLQVTESLGVAEFAEAPVLTFKPSNVYGIRYPFSSICFNPPQRNRLP